MYIYIERDRETERAQKKQVEKSVTWYSHAKSKAFILWDSEFYFQWQVKPIKA